jgi:hypothetical protein
MSGYPGTGLVADLREAECASCDLVEAAALAPRAVPAHLLRSRTAIVTAGRDHGVSGAPHLWSLIGDRDHATWCVDHAFEDPKFGELRWLHVRAPAQHERAETLAESPGPSGRLMPCQGPYEQTPTACQRAERGRADVRFSAGTGREKPRGSLDKPLGLDPPGCFPGPPPTSRPAPRCPQRTHRPNLGSRRSHGSRHFAHAR